MDPVNKFLMYTNPALERRNALDAVVSRAFRQFCEFMEKVTNNIPGVTITLTPNYTDKFDFFQFRDVRDYVEANGAVFTPEMRAASEVTPRTLTDEDLIYICAQMSACCRELIHIRINLVFDCNVSFKYMKGLVQSTIDVPRYKYIMIMKPLDEIQQSYPATQIYSTQYAIAPPEELWPPQYDTLEKTN